MTRTSFHHPVSELHFDTYKPQDVKAALEDFVALAHERVQHIIKTPRAKRTYENTIQALYDSTQELDLLGDIVSHLAAALAGDWEQQEQIVSEATSTFYSARSLNPKLHKAVQVVSESRFQLNLTDHQIRSLEDLLAHFRRSGVELPVAKRRRIQNIHLELTQLSTEFAQNVVHASDEAHLVIATEDEVAGVPKNITAEWQKEAKAHNVQGFYIQYNSPNYQVVMSNCDAKTTRDAMHKLSRTRAPHNEAIARRMVALRAELAKILGYKTYVDYVVERRMAKRASNAQSFIDELTHAYRQTMLDETKELTMFVRDLTGDPKYFLDFTDVDSGFDLYYASKLRQKKYAVDPNIRLEEYLTLDTVLQVMFETLTTLYGVQFKPADQAVCHSDVTVYDVFDEDGKHISTAWCDWFARKGKRAGAWEHTVYIADRVNGATDKPHLGLVNANFPRPTKTMPSLLTITDVETMWHEFGHFMHMSLGRTELRDQNGYECVWDFIEAPSQIMENWVWQDEILRKMAKHYKTGKQLPDSYIRKLRESRSFRAASNAMWTLFWSQTDLYIHSVFDTKAKVGLNEMCRKVKGGYFGVQVAPYDTTICTFTHICAGGYAAGYYGYKWAESIEADLFSRFAAEGALNPATGRMYRDKVLARGDEVDAEVEIRDFLGRNTNIEAMLKRDDIDRRRGRNN